MSTEAPVTRPSLETVAELYVAAAAQQQAADRAMQNVITSGQRHGYSERQIITAAFTLANHKHHALRKTHPQAIH